MKQKRMTLLTRLSLIVLLVGVFFSGAVCTGWAADGAGDPPAIESNAEGLGYTDTYPGKLVPFAGMAIAVLIVWIVMGMVKASDRQRHETIRSYLEKGVEVPWELLVDDGNPQTWRPVSDLRKAMVWLAVGLGIGLMGYIFTGSTRALALGLVFDFIGIGYLIVWKIEPTRPADEEKQKRDQ